MEIGGFVRKYIPPQKAPLAYKNAVWRVLKAQGFPPEIRAHDFFNVPTHLNAPKLTKKQREKVVGELGTLAKQLRKDVDQGAGLDTLHKHNMVWMMINELENPSRLETNAQTIRDLERLSAKEKIENK